MQRGDLHIHTTTSDGCLSPAQVALGVASSDLGFFAIADHNSIAGLGRARAALPAEGPRMINGVELSARPAEDGELHILGYGFDPGCEVLREACHRIVARKKEQLLGIIRRLQRQGIDVDVTALLKNSDETYTGRPMLARQLVETGACRSAGAAFGRFLGEGAPTFVPMEPFAPESCIDAIRGAGGLAVLAHPTIRTVDCWLKKLCDAGLAGVEAYRPRLRGNQALYIEKAAEHFGLCVTGGSDWHGRENEAPIGDFAVSRAELSDFFGALDNGHAG